jgi:hypothetical protein
LELEHALFSARPGCGVVQEHDSNYVCVQVQVQVNADIPDRFFSPDPLPRRVRERGADSGAENTSPGANSSPRSTNDSASRSP